MDITAAELPNDIEKGKVRKLWGQAVDIDRKRTEACIAIVKAIEALEDKYPKLAGMTGRDAEEYYMGAFGISRPTLIKMQNITGMHEELGADVARELPAPWTTQQELASKFKGQYDKLAHLIETKAITPRMEASEVREVVGQVIPPKKRNSTVIAPASTGYVMQPMTITATLGDGHDHELACRLCGTLFQLDAHTASTMRQVGRPSYIGALNPGTEN